MIKSGLAVRADGGEVGSVGRKDCKGTEINFVHGPCVLTLIMHIHLSKFSNCDI